MKKIIIIIVLISAAFVLSACAPTISNNQTVPVMTATPGSMRAENPEAAHMMEPITAPNVQPATETEGGQQLEYRKDNGLKIFELTTKAMQ